MIWAKLYFFFKCLPLLLIAALALLWLIGSIAEQIGKWLETPTKETE